MYQVASQIITQLYVFTFLYVIYTAISLFNITNKVTYCSKIGKKDKTLTNVMFCLLLFMCVIYNNNGDYYSYLNWFIHGYGETAATDEWIEPIYYWIKSVLPPYFILFRLVVWGTGIFVYKKLCEKLGVNLLLAYILFGIFYTFAYSYARASLGIVISCYAFVLLINKETKSKVFYIKVLLLFVLATFLHKSCLSLIFILLISLLLKFNKTTLVIMAVAFIPLSTVLNANLGIIGTYVGLSEMQSERYFSSDVDILDRSSEITLYIPILILLGVSVIKLYNNRNKIPKEIQRIVMATIAIMYIASLLTTLSITFVQTISIRFYLMAFVFGIICCTYTIQNLKINRFFLVAIFSYHAIIYIYQILVRIKYGAVELVERYYN